MNDCEEPIFRLISFFEAMETWGQRAIDHFNDPARRDMPIEQKQEYRHRQRDEFRQIFCDFCEKGEFAMRAMDEGVSFSLDQPEYSSTNFDLLDANCTEQEAQITIQENFGMKWVVRFKLIFVKGQWLIKDERMFKGKQDDTWAKKPL